MWIAKLMKENWPVIILTQNSYITEEELMDGFHGWFKRRVKFVCIATYVFLSDDLVFAHVIYM